MEMENVDKAIATVSGLQVGTYHFRLTVRDQQGLSSTSTLAVAVKKGEWTWQQDLSLPCLPASRVPRPVRDHPAIVVFACEFTADGALLGAGQPSP